MQKIIYFTPIPETGNLASIVTDKTPTELTELGVIPKNSKYLINDFDPDNDEQAAQVYHINYMKFDNNNNPQNIILDKELLVTAVLQDIRTKRVIHLEELDMLQSRALVMGLTSVVSEIEEDKNILRNIPNTIDFADRHSIRKIYSNCPAELFVNYKSKYESKLKRS